MVHTHQPIDAHFVRSILDYDPATGMFTWRERHDVPRRWNTRYAGKPAGTLTHDGYIKIQISKGKHYFAHVLAWLYVTGWWRPNDIDHHDGDRSNNRKDNLRVATKSENGINKAVQSNNKTGFIGVHFDSQRGLFRATINVKGVRHDGGHHATAEQAARARANLADRLHGEFTPENAKKRSRYSHSRDYRRRHP